MKIYTNLEEAAALPSNHQYGNGVAIFTQNGRAARDFAASVNVGMVGVNVPIPVPVSYHTFGGWKRSAFGDTNQYGTEGTRFWTKPILVNGIVYCRSSQGTLVARDHRVAGN